MAVIHVGDIGTKIILSVNTDTDISSGIDEVINYKKPDGTTGQWAATINGNDIEYTTIADDLDIPGTWKLQGFVNLGTWQGCTNSVDLTVNGKIV